MCSPKRVIVLVALISEIVVRNADGEYRQLIVDPVPPKRGYYANTQEHFVIDNRGRLVSRCRHHDRRRTDA